MATKKKTSKKTPATKKKAAPKRAAAKSAAPKRAAAKSAAPKRAAPRKPASKKTASPKKTSARSSHPVAVTSPANLKALEKLRKLSLALPGATEALNHGRPCFCVRDKTFVMFLDNHHDDGRVAIWCKAPPGAQSTIVESDPVRYFVPPYVGPKGWIGARLDRKPDWTAIEALVEESYAMTAPRPKRQRSAT